VSKKTGGHTFKDFLPLVAMIAIVIILTGIFSFIRTPASWMPFMTYFYVCLLFVFGGLKLVRLKTFAIAYKEYDVIAIRSNFYAHFYPFLEIIFGIALLLNFVPLFTNWMVFIVMSISALGVYLKLRKGEEVPCACLGMVFKVPMTWVTLIEDLLMAAMALVMIII